LHVQHVNLRIHVPCSKTPEATRDSDPHSGQVFCSLMAGSSAVDTLIVEPAGRELDDRRIVAHRHRPAPASRGMPPSPAEPRRFYRWQHHLLGPMVLDGSRNSTAIRTSPYAFARDDRIGSAGWDDEYRSPRGRKRACTQPARSRETSGERGVRLVLRYVRS
jgi:hypothetical protein